jgi:hypothetical protein
MHGAFVGLVAGPVAVGLLDDDVSLYQETLKDFGDLKARELGLARSDGDVFEVAKDGEDGGLVEFRGDGECGVVRALGFIRHRRHVPSDL